MIDERRLLQPEHVQPLLAHIDAEEVALRHLRRLLEDLPAGVASEDLHRSFRQRVDDAMQESIRLAEQRIIVLTHTGRLSGMRPEQITLTGLIRKASSKTVPALVSAHRRLQRVIRQIQSLAGVVCWVMNESRSINATILQELLGQDNSDRYTARGQRSLDPSTIRFETRS